MEIGVPPPRKGMEPVEALWDGNGGIPTGVNRQTPVKPVPSPSVAGGYK